LHRGGQRQEDIMKSATWLALAAMLGLGVTASAKDKPSADDSPKTGGQTAERHPNRTGGDHTASGERAKPREQPAVKHDGSTGDKRGVTPTDAQLRHPRAGTGRGDRDREWRYGYHDYRPYNRYRYGYWDQDAYWAPYYYGYGYGYGYGSSYPRYSRGYYREAGALRLRVEPEQTKVFVDGYYAGVVDDFDGIFQRLYLAPGRHEVMLRLDGHRSHTFRIYVPIDQTLKLHHRMVAGEGNDRADFGGEWDDEADARPSVAARGAEPEATPAVEREAWGSLRLDVQPGDASVYVDGEFRGTVREARTMRLPAGVHKVEIVRPGFRTIERDARVEPDETEEIVAELEKN
jgi:hypothetical protein